MDFVDETFDLFEKHVPHGHEAFMVLKAHLLVEIQLREFVQGRINDSEVVKEIFASNSNFRSGSGLALLAKALGTCDEFAPDPAIPWKAIDILNNLRNDLAHLLEPNVDSINQKMTNFIEAMGHDLSGTLTINQVFRLCAVQLVGFVGMHKTPARAEDYQ